MLTRNCRLCGLEKTDYTALLCDDCKADDAAVKERVEKEKLPYWEAQTLLNSMRDSRRRKTGMAGRMDPRQIMGRIDTTELQERGLI
jgi:hypothetical protein